MPIYLENKKFVKRQADLVVPYNVWQTHGVRYREGNERRFPAVNKLLWSTISFQFSESLREDSQKCITEGPLKKFQLLHNFSKVRFVIISRETFMKFKFVSRSSDTRKN